MDQVRVNKKKSKKYKKICIHTNLQHEQQHRYE